MHRHERGIYKIAFDLNLMTNSRHSTAKEQTAIVSSKWQNKNQIYSTFKQKKNLMLLNNDTYICIICNNNKK